MLRKGKGQLVWVRPVRRSTIFLEKGKEKKKKGGSLIPRQRQKAYYYYY